MNTSSSAARTYRVLCWLALIHALFLFALLWVIFFPSVAETPWAVRERIFRGWVGLATLWIFWPLVLIFHRRRTGRRLALFASLIAVILLPSLLTYNRRAPTAFGLPWGVSMNPVSCWQYFSAYRIGRAAAQKDIASNILAREVYGFGAGGGPTAAALGERYHIETRPIAGCVVNEKVVGHATGYNRVSEKEFERRFGRGSVAKTEAESMLGLLFERSDSRERSRDVARRLSVFPPESKITLESVEVVLIRGGGALTQVSEDQLGRLVREIEGSLAKEVLENPSPFRFHVTANFAPEQAADYVVDGLPASPRQAYDKIQQKLPPFRWSQLDGDALSVRLNFVVQPNST